MISSLGVLPKASLFRSCDGSPTADVVNRHKKH